MSRSKTAPFIDLCARGEALLEEIDDYIDRWHASNASGDLHEFLGMEWEEYAAWVAVPEILPYIVTARKEGRPLERILSEAESLPIAGRSDRPLQIRAIKELLRRQGRVA